LLREDRLKIAVFIDFDNIEIGVRNTLNRNLDISAVLEAIKERGEIVTKVAYGDWKRSGDYGRTMGQHAIHMVQRNPTPGGDKNGADINLALDALEMAFTRDHINAFVIVGGDSDFMTLVEKLKQYDKKVIVVGGRGFTSSILQKNCHEFIAYENLIRSSPGRRQPGRSRSVSEISVDKAIPLVRRALKILTDREVSPQLGLLKSTLLQLDSTFSEQDYGATTFRDFVEKLARTGEISLKQVDRSIMVELRDDNSVETEEDGKDTSQDGSGRTNDGVRLIRSVFEKADALKWPMYLRGVKQLIKAAEPDFDERDYGFSSLLDVLRQTQKAGVVKLERNRQGVLRIFPGEEISEPPMPRQTSSPENAVAVPETLAGQEPPADDLTSGAAEGGEVTVEVEQPQRKRQPARKKTTRKAKTTKKTTTKKAKKRAVRKPAASHTGETTDA
jgi:uncharacterized protein (TIGR00288 family)